MHLFHWSPRTWAIAFLILELLSITTSRGRRNSIQISVPPGVATLLALTSPHVFPTTFLALISPLATSIAILWKERLSKRGTELILFLSFATTMMCMLAIRNNSTLALLLCIFILALPYVARGVSLNSATKLAAIPIVGLAGFLLYLQ